MPEAGITGPLLLVLLCSPFIQGQGHKNNDFEPDVFRNISGLITSKGYPVEEHEIWTSEGYILGVQRIPHGHNRLNRAGDASPVVLLHHGLLSSGVDFVSNFPNQSLGFVLADSGYDVWITNARGNIYSQRHVTLSPKSLDYWKFSWDQMALVDLPETIDYVLNATGQEKLLFVGHSMGTTTILALLSDKPEYNAKIRAVAAMAPVALLGYTKSAIRFLTPFQEPVEFLFQILGHGELAPPDFFQKLVMEVFCLKKVQVCFTWENAINGISAKQFNFTRTPVYLANLPAGTSVYTLVHFLQIITANKFQKYDFGPKENMKKYNQSSPPEYDIGKITAPLALMWGLNDPTADPVDVNLLAAQLKSLALNYQVPDPEWSHDDFVIGIDAHKLVYQQMLKFFSEHGSN